MSYHQNYGPDQRSRAHGSRGGDHPSNHGNDHSRFNVWGEAVSFNQPSRYQQSRQNAQPHNSYQSRYGSSGQFSNNYNHPSTSSGSSSTHHAPPPPFVHQQPHFNNQHNNFYGSSQQNHQHSSNTVVVNGGRKVLVNQKNVNINLSGGSIYINGSHINDFVRNNFYKGTHQEHSSAAKHQSAPPQPLTTKYLRRMGPKAKEHARHGKRQFCSYTSKREHRQLSGLDRTRLQFVYKIKACLWHRTKRGLHKKKKKLEGKQARYRAIIRNGIFCRKPHGMHWTRNSAKPEVTVVPRNPWRRQAEQPRETFHPFVENYVPLSWQDAQHAYFSHCDFQLFKVNPGGLEFGCLSHHLSEGGLQIVQAVRLQNLTLYGLYLSKRQQLVAIGSALTEVVRYCVVKKDELKVLCKYGLERRRLSNLQLFPNVLLAHENRHPNWSDVVLVAARVVTVHSKNTKLSNEMYPEYIIEYKPEE